MENTKITGAVISVQDLEKGINIILDTTTDNKPSQLQIVTTRHEDLQHIKRGSKIKIEISHDN